MEGMNEQPAALLPELILILGAVTALLVGIFQPRDRQWIARALAAVVLAACIVVTLLQLRLGPGNGMFYGDSWAVDQSTNAVRVIASVAALITLALGGQRLRDDPRETEFAVLVVLATLGTVVFAGAADLLVLAVAYLLASIPLYALAGWGRDPRGAEAALKIYLFGALFGVVMLLGVTLMLGAGGGSSTYTDLASSLRSAGTAGVPRLALAAGLLAVLAGLFFKAGAVPAHFWVPDAAEGATAPAAAFLTTVPKIGALAAAYRLVLTVPDTLVDWRLLIAVVAAASMTLGNLGAFYQDSPKRLLGYSTISQVGYLLMAVAIAGRDSALPALLGYLAAYAVTNLAAFAVVAALPNLVTIGDYRGLARRRPALTAVLVVSLLGLVGTPPTAVFVGKVSVFAATWDAGMAWLVAVAAVNTVASLYYYLRWLAPSFSASEAEPELPKGPTLVPWAGATAVVSGIAALAVGPLYGLLLAMFEGGLAR